MPFRRISRLLLATALAAAMFAVAPAPPAAADGPVSAVTADFSANLGQGSPNVFGAAINTLNDPSQVTALRQAGEKIARRDLYLWDIVPPTTLAGWNANTNNVRDPSTWDWSKYGWVDEYKKQGFTLMAIMSYSLPWLGPDGCTGDQCKLSVPRDLTIYADIVEKIYRHFQGKLDMVEIWNEPDGPFLSLVPGDPRYSTLLDAYCAIYATASQAVRKADPTVPIGGPAVANPAANDWGRALKDRFPAANVNFMTYHHYSTTSNEVVSQWRTLGLPVYVTEWNWDWRFDQNPMDSDHPDAMSFVANRLTTMYRQGAAGAMFYAENLQSPVDHTFFGTYANGTLTAKSRVMRLLSTDLGLGAGPSTIRSVSVANAGAATTALGEQVAWVVNDDPAPRQVDLTLRGIGAGFANIFVASADQGVISPRSTVAVSGDTTLKLGVPAKSVVGVRLTGYPIADETNLAPAATVTASSQTAGLGASLVKDGIIGRWGDGEWAAQGPSKAWVRLTWPAAQSVGRVVLYDRSNTNDQISGGTLTFSDGSTVQVPELPDGGDGKSITFAPRDVSWVQLTIDKPGPNTVNSGLSEFQVFHGDNIAPDSIVTASSETDAAVRAVDGIVGQASGQWTSRETTPWIRTTWLNARAVNEIVLRDRTGGGHANGGTLTFDDGSTVAVTGIPADGSPKSVSFPAKWTKSVRFAATGGTGSNVGLAEFQVFQAANYASSAQVSASSAYNVNGDYLPATNATDDTINQWFRGEWGADGARDGRPSITLSWPADRPATISRVVLYDRNNLTDLVTGGTLTFSDGSTVAVPSLDNSGLGVSVTFPAKSTSSVRFSVTSVGSGTLNAGLSEIQVF